MSRSLLPGFLLLTAALAAQAPPTPPPLSIEHVTVIDSTGGPPLVDVTVDIADGLIGRIGKPLKGTKPAPGTKVINGKGKFLIPGLWDMHVHISDPGQFFPRFLAAGVTGVREMYSGFYPAAAAQWRLRPDAPLLALPGFIDGPMMLNSGPLPPGSAALTRPEEVPLAFQYFFQAGADFLKIYNSVPREVFLAIAEQARAIGIPFVGHVPEAVSPKEASLLGMRSQEHLINILLACSTNEDALRKERLETMTSPALSPTERLRRLGFPQAEGLFDTYDPAKAADLFRTFVEHDTWQVPTLALLQGFAYGDVLVKDPRVKWMPEAWRRTGHPKDKIYMSDLPPGGYDLLVERIRALLDRHKQLVRDMHAAGVPLLAGTDVSIANPVLIGFGLHDELALLVESGLTPLEALQTATRNPAVFFGRLPQAGTIETGKIADLVLLDADPLKDIHNVGKIRAVVERGRLWERKQLDELLK